MLHPVAAPVSAVVFDMTLTPKPSPGFTALLIVALLLVTSQ